MLSESIWTQPKTSNKQIKGETEDEAWVEATQCLEADEGTEGLVEAGPADGSGQGDNPDTAFTTKW